jgi:hypothetical protein
LKIGIGVEKGDGMDGIKKRAKGRFLTLFIDIP